MEQLQEETWLLFVLAEAGTTSARRVRVWRALKALRPAILRDGVYLLPSRPDLAAELAERAADVRRGAGHAYVFAVSSATVDVATLRAFFDRGADFAELATVARDVCAREDGVLRSEIETRRALRALKRDLAALVATDYYASAARDEAVTAIAAAESMFVERFSPGEPRGTARAIVRRDRNAFRRRVWVTRERLWVDRLASAWLIRRFVDPDATFLWLANVADRPSDAVGFDFDGATFTHVGDAVTFDVLARSFDLDGDVALARVADLVRSLDLSSVPRTAEAAGLEAMLVGARERFCGDDALFAAVAPLFEFLYLAFARGGASEIVRVP